MNLTGYFKALAVSGATFLPFMLTGCRDAALDDKVEVYSDGKLIKTYRAVDRTLEKGWNDSCFFFDRETGKRIEVSGDYVIEHDAYNKPSTDSPKP